MRKQLSELLNSKDFDDGQKIGSEKTLRRWRSACNGRRSFHKLAGPDDRLKLQLLGEYEKRALAVFYLVLEATSFLLDIFGKSKKSILLAAFLLSAFGFAITMSTHVRRNIAATRMHLQKRLLMVLEISFSLVQLIVMLIYFILAQLGVKNNFNTSVFPLVFAIIAAVFTFKYDGEVTDSSGPDSALVALAAGSQV
ncbi:hypothetical protein CICLE_v10003259mg [Citrus x clementina]|uniref:Uncharacterized protein n=1 Tax=Citrus clementina TaxID=85681 RepID=V4SVC1_CITCL|nr:hypothetical protein CICLE_v10003259mg [Citrus x clementina]